MDGNGFTMQNLARFRQRIREKAVDPSAPPVLIVALGDSVTQGFMEERRFDFEAVYHHRLKQLLEARYPQTTFSVVNAGCGGESLPGGARRLDRDVIRHQPDLVLVAYGLNDACGGGRAGVAAFQDGLADLVRRIRGATEAAVVLLTPNRMMTHDNDRVAPRWKTKVEPFIQTQREGVLDAYAQAVRRVAADQRVALADVYDAWCRLEAGGVDTTLCLSNGINHPTADMHAQTARLIMQTIESLG